MEADPPPDLWVEVDGRGSPSGRLPLYASLAVPEVWRYRAGSGKLWFGLLAGGRFHPIDRGLSLPMLTTAIVRDLLANARQAPDDMSWDEQTRAWLRGTLKPAYEASL